MAFPIRVRGFSRRGFRVDNDSRASYAVEATVDLDDYKNRRVLDNQNANWWSPPEFPMYLRKAGTLATATTASGLSLIIPRPLVLKSVIATVGTAPASTPVILDVNKIPAGGQATDAGTTVFTTQSRRPTIAASTTVSTLDATNGVPQVSAFAKGDILHVDIDGVGTVTTGSDLAIYFRFDLV